MILPDPADPAAHGHAGGHLHQRQPQGRAGGALDQPDGLPVQAAVGQFHDDRDRQRPRPAFQLRRGDGDLPLPAERRQAAETCRGGGDISINYASIAFTKVTATCNDPTDQSACYTANVVWTSTGTAQPYGANYRPCSTPQLPADNTATPSRTALPRSVFGPATLIVIDVVFNFTPTLGSKFFPAIKIARSAYVQPRYASLINYDTTNNDGIATKMSRLLTSVSRLAGRVPRSRVPARATSASSSGSV